MAFTKDRGIDFRIPTGINLTGISAAHLRLRAPTLVDLIEWDCSVFDSENGVLRYITSVETEHDELDSAGEWQAQAKVNFASGEVFYGAIVKFTVGAVLV